MSDEEVLDLLDVDVGLNRGIDTIQLLRMGEALLLVLHCG